MNMCDVLMLIVQDNVRYVCLICIYIVLIIQNNLIFNYIWKIVLL